MRRDVTRSAAIPPYRIPPHHQPHPTPQPPTNTYPEALLGDLWQLDGLVMVEDLADVTVVEVCDLIWS